MAKGANIEENANLNSESETQEEFKYYIRN
jgi:hypothetical protein